MAAILGKFVGGPCDGKYSIIFTYELGAGGSTKCKGATYYLQPDTTQPVIFSQTKPVTTVTQIGPGAMHAWNQLRREINKTLPAELHRADQYLRATLHELRRIRVR